MSHQQESHRKNEQVKLKTFAALSTLPVHEKAVVRMHLHDRNYHVHGDAKGGDSRQESENQTDAAEELGGDCQKGEGGWDAHVLREGGHGGVEAGTAEPASMFCAPCAKKIMPSTRRTTATAGSDPV